MAGRRIVKLLMVKIYSRTTCGPCRQLKRYLAMKDVAYEEINIDDHPEQIADILSLTGYMQVPTLVVGGEAVSGLNMPRISQLLDSLTIIV